MKRVKLPLGLRLVQGAIGKKFVMKHYKYGIIKTRYPNMLLIKPSEAQRACRNSFREAVAFAKKDYSDLATRLAWQKKLRKKTRLFGAIVKEYMLMEKRAREAAMETSNRMIRNCFKNSEGKQIISEYFLSGEVKLRIFKTGVIDKCIPEIIHDEPG